MFDHFDILAPIYDRAIPFSRLEQMVKNVDLPVAGTLLDAGGGTGRVAAALRPFVDNIVVADFSKGMLVQSRKKCLIAVQTYTEKLPFPNNYFERIIMVDALHHVSNQVETITELWRVLSDHGCLVIEEPDLRTWQVKILAVVEKMFLMRSNFLSPPRIAALFPSSAKIIIKSEGYNAWVIVRK